MGQERLHEHEDRDGDSLVLRHIDNRHVPTDGRDQNFVEEGYLLDITSGDNDEGRTTGTVWVTRELLLSLASKIPPAVALNTIEEVEEWLTQ